MGFSPKLTFPAIDGDLGDVAQADNKAKQIKTQIVRDVLSTVKVVKVCPKC